jgi:RimJ/RimL family protein N-acetyltransferase
MKGGEAIGYCSFDRYTKDEDTAYVHLLNVRPDYHGKKIGKELVLMCVNETIARGMPRLDIHTWPGNTKSVPLYKKCGFMWEDRTDTTHLCNFIPTVLSTELFEGFFENADWYTDSARKIEIKPDGVKSDKFEFFEYEWEKDGQHLRVGLEKTGRRIRLVETNDYSIEMAADSHELAFGLSYNCRFVVKNKTSKKLDVAINAKSDGAISFDGAWAGTVADEAVYEGTFFVNAITEDLDPMRMHPCVLADVRVGGKHAVFGLGIEPKFPVSVSLAGKHRVAKRGICEDVYINIKNNLPRDATVKFALPENLLTHFDQSAFELRLVRGRDAMLKTRTIIRDCGYTSLPISCGIELDGGDTINVTRPLHIVNQGVEGMFAFETNECHGAANGLWRLKLNKQSNTVNLDRIVPSGHGEFNVSRLGKPYDDEFNIAKPTDVRVTKADVFITLEADFESKKFQGAQLTEIYEIDAAGTLRQRHRVTNIGQKPLSLSVKYDFWTNISKRTVLHSHGDYRELADDRNYGIDVLARDSFSENWMFDTYGDNPTGICWPLQYAPKAKWGDMLEFEHETGDLAPGQSFETEPIVYMCGVFKNFHDFRNYAIGITDEISPFVNNHLEVVVNKTNPVLTESNLPLALRNNSMSIRGGSIAVSSPDDLFDQDRQDIPDGELQAETAFAVQVKPSKSGLGFVDFKLRLSGFEDDTRRALLVPDDTRIVSRELDGVLTVTNGKLGFSVAPGFSDAAYSLTLDGNEWFYTRYPTLEPYAWWNPFVGGLKTYLERMGSSLVLREEITASFDSATDSFGNVWTGIRADVSIEKADEYKGMRYAQYYLTLPGVPVLCHFMTLYSGVGRFMDAELYSMAFLSGKDGKSDMLASMATEDNKDYRLRFCGDDHEMNYDRLIAFSRDGETKRQERLYIYKDSIRDRGKLLVAYDINTVYCDFNMKGYIADGEQHTTRPVFCILTDKALTLETLTDLSRITF